MQAWEIESLIGELRGYTAEREWFEFKDSNADPELLGKTISALANSACLDDLSCGYLIYGIDDGNHEIIGTSFDPWAQTRGNQALMVWINSQLSPTIDLDVNEWTSPDQKKLIVFKIPAAVETPVRPNHVIFLRQYVGRVDKNWEPYLFMH